CYSHPMKLRLLYPRMALSLKKRACRSMECPVLVPTPTREPVPDTLPVSYTQCLEAICTPGCRGILPATLRIYALHSVIPQELYEYQYRGLEGCIFHSYGW